MNKKTLEKNKALLLKTASDIFKKYPVSFAYLYGSYATGVMSQFSDMDVGVYVERIFAEKCLDLELSLSLEIDTKLDHCVASEVRIINNLPLSLVGEMITEGILIYSANESVRVDFETSVRRAYFDFLPVLHRYHNMYIEHISS